MMIECGFEYYKTQRRDKDGSFLSHPVFRHFEHYVDLCKRYNQATKNIWQNWYKQYRYLKKLDKMKNQEEKKSNED